MKRSIKIKQHDVTDCGAACLASVCAHYGLKVPVARIRQYAYTDQKGTNILGMVEAAQKLGFSAKGVRGVYDALSMIPIPAIAHVVIKEVLHHFVVLYKISKRGLSTWILLMEKCIRQQGKNLRKCGLGFWLYWSQTKLSRKATKKLV